VIYSFEGKTPSVHPSAFIAPTAVLIGDVTVEANASVWFGAVLRGDAGAIVIGEGTNIQDNAVLHEGAIIGRNCVVAHHALVHAAVLGDRVLVANGAMVFQQAKLGDDVIIGAGAMLIGPVEAAPRTLWLGVPAKQVREVDDNLIAMTKRLNDAYIRNRARYHAGFHPADDIARTLAQQHPVR